MTCGCSRACGRPDLEPDVRATASREIPDQYLSSAKAREALGWAPAHGLDAGLAAHGRVVPRAPGHAASLAA